MVVVGVDVEDGRRGADLLQRTSMTKLAISSMLGFEKFGKSSMFRLSSLLREVGSKARGFDVSRSLTRCLKDLAAARSAMGTAAQQTDYSKWSNDSLIERVTQLEQKLKG